jgi:hypothetical protein
MVKARLLIAVALLFLPAFALADSSDPQMDPNNCTGSLQVSFVPGTNTLQNTADGHTFSTSFLGTPTTSSNPVCFANMTGTTLTSLTVTTTMQAGLTYSCPTGGDPFFLGCGTSFGQTPNGETVTFAFSGTNSDHPGIVPFTNSCNVDITTTSFNPCPGEFDLLSTGFPSTPSFSLSVPGVPAPEPATVGMMLLSLPALLFYRRRRRRAI